MTVTVRKQKRAALDTLVTRPHRMKVRQCTKVRVLITGQVDSSRFSYEQKNSELNHFNDQD